MAEVLPLLYLHGLSVRGLRAGAGAVPRLGRGPVGGDGHPAHRAVARRRARRSASGRWPETDYVYLWVDGIHLKVRLEQDKVCLLVMIGVRADGTKELVALADGFRESVGVVGRPAPRLQAPGHARPGARGRRRRAGVLEGAPRGVPRHQGAALLVAQARQRARRAAEVGAPRREGRAGGDLQRRGQGPRPQGRAKAFAADYGAKWPKAVAKIIDDLDVLLAFYDFPAEHWIHLRTTNPIESTFATVRLRQRVTKGPGSRAAGIAMAFKLIESAQARWRAVNAPHLVALVRAGADVQERQARRTTRRIRR